MFRNLCWSTDCIFVCTDSLICLCMTGHKGYGSEGSLDLGKRTRKQILLSSFPPFRFLPYSRFQFWGYSNDGRKYIEKKRKKLPFCQFIQLNQVADGLEESWRGHKGRGWTGTSKANTSAEAIQSAQAFLPTTSSLQLPGCTDNKAPSVPISKAATSNLLVSYYLPIDRLLTPITLLAGIYFLQVPHSVSNRPLVVANWEFPA